MIQPSDDVSLHESSSFPQRPGTPDCLYFTRTGFCDYGSNCRFNHPPNKMMDAFARAKDDYPERLGEPECQFYLKTGTCKFGPACKYHHPKEKAGILGKASVNEAGYPLRLGEKDCAFYMQTGTCKFGTTCKFNHPQPASLTSLMEIPWHTSASATPISSSPPLSSLSLARAPYIPALPLQRPCFPPMLAPPEGLLSMFGWTTCQSPMRAVMPTTPLEARNQTVEGAAMYGAAAPQNIPVPYYPYAVGSAPTNFVYSYMMSKDSLHPERPGEPECKYFLKTGDCKFGTYCRFNHPKRKNLLLPYCNLSPIGLPQRPGIEPCTFYMQYGTCKFGTWCRFDHPLSSLTYSPLQKSLTSCPFLPYPLTHTVPKPTIDTLSEQGEKATETAPNHEKTLTTLVILETVEQANADENTST